MARMDQQPEGKKCQRTVINAIIDNIAKLFKMANIPLKDVSVVSFLQNTIGQLVTDCGVGSAILVGNCCYLLSFGCKWGTEDDILNRMDQLEVQLLDAVLLSTWHNSARISRLGTLHCTHMAY